MTRTAQFFLRRTLQNFGRPALPGDELRTILVAVIDGDITSTGQDEFFNGQIQVDHAAGHMVIQTDTPVVASPVTDGASLLYILHDWGRFYRLAQQREAGG